MYLLKVLFFSKKIYGIPDAYLRTVVSKSDCDISVKTSLNLDQSWNLTPLHHGQIFMAAANEASLYL